MSTDLYIFLGLTASAVAAVLAWVKLGKKKPEDKEGVYTHAPGDKGLSHTEDGHDIKWGSIPINLYACTFMGQEHLRACKKAVKYINRAVNLDLIRMHEGIPKDTFNTITVSHGYHEVGKSGQAKIEYSKEGTIFSAEITFDSSVNNPKAVIVHEVVHALGHLGHDSFHESVMYKDVAGKAVMSNSDAQGLRARYQR